MSTTKYSVSGTSVHASYREALEAVAEYICAGRSYAWPSDATDDELIEWIEEHAEQDGTDWDVNEVQQPAPAKPPRDRVEEIRLAVCDLKDAAERLRLAGAPYARLAARRAIKSAEGALRHARRGLPASTRKVTRQRRSLAEQLMAHRSADPHCTCTDCIAWHDAHLKG
jgi:hypothetical protein